MPNDKFNVNDAYFAGGLISTGQNAAVFDRLAQQSGLSEFERWVLDLSKALSLEGEKVLVIWRAVAPSGPPHTSEELAAAIELFGMALRRGFPESKQTSVIELHRMLEDSYLDGGAERRGAITDVPVSIYVDDESAGPDIERAVVELLDTLGIKVTGGDPPIRRSWFRRLRARSRRMVDSAEFADVMAKATRALELHALDQPQAQVDAAQGDAAAKLITALGASKIRNAVMQLGSILVVKVEDNITVRTLTALEMACLARRPDLLHDAHAALTALRLEAEQAAAALLEGQTARSGQ